MLEPEKFEFAFRAFGVELSHDELCTLMKYFDQDRTGKINVNDLLHAMRSSSLNERREKAVRDAYQHVAATRGTTIADFEAAYDVRPNP